MDEVTELEDLNEELGRQLANSRAKADRIAHYMKFLRSFTKRLKQAPTTTKAEKHLLDLQLESAEGFLEGGSNNKGGE